MKTSFEVTEAAPFVIKYHETSSRIYPPVPYKVQMTLLANQAAKGTVEEPVPASFKISNISPGGKISGKNGEEQTITWPIDLKSGESMELSYTYLAPNISPEFYLLGPLEVKSQITSNNNQINPNNQNLLKG